MNKICSKCNTPVDINATFCQNCGSTEFSAPAQQSYDGYIQPPMQQPPVQPVYQQQFQAPVNVQPQKKSMPAWKIILIILGAIALIVVGIVIAFSFDVDSEVIVDDVETEYVEPEENDEKETESDTDADVESDEPTEPFLGFDIEYTEGEIVDGAYYNEWANLYIPASSSWPIADEIYFTTFENSVTDCGFASVNMTNGSTGAICFENISAQPASFSAQDYIDVLESSAYTMYGDTLVLNTDNPEVTIAGEKYLTLGFTHTTTGAVLRYHVRILDGYAIVIFASGVGEGAINSFINNITTVNGI